MLQPINKINKMNLNLEITETKIVEQKTDFKYHELRLYTKYLTAMDERGNEIRLVSNSLMDIEIIIDGEGVHFPNGLKIEKKP